MRDNYTEPRLVGKDQSHLHLGHLKLFVKYFWGLVPINAPSYTEHFYTDTTKVGNLWLIRVWGNWEFFKPKLCAAGYISPFPLKWQSTQDWHKPLQIFILNSYSARATPWPDSSVTNTSFGVAKSKEENWEPGMKGEAAAFFSRIVWILTVLNPMKISVIVSVHQTNKTNNTEKGCRKIKLANSKISIQR